MKKEKIKISVFICKKHRVQAVLNRNKMSTCSDSRYCCPKCYDFDNLQEITTFARILTKEPKVKMTKEPKVEKVSTSFKVNELIEIETITGVWKIVFFVNRLDFLHINYCVRPNKGSHIYHTNRYRKIS